MAIDYPWDYRAIFERNPAYKQSDIDELKKWVASEDSSSVIPNDVSDKLLLCFYNACDLNMEDTKKCVKTYFSCRDKAPEFFDDRDLKQPALLDSSQYVDYAIMSERSKEDYPILYHGLSEYTPENYHFCDAVKLLLMTMEMCVYEHGPVKGVILLFDMRGVKLGHLTRVNLSSLAKFFTYIQEGMPIRIKKIYIMNAVSFFDKVLMLLKPFMKKELVSLLHLFPPDADYAAFQKDELSKKCLPKHYEGDQADADVLNKENNEKLSALKSYFENEEKHRYAFSKKSKKRAKVEKGFQDLSID